MGKTTDSVTKVLEKHALVVNDGYVSAGGARYGSYALSILRGVVGKSTLAFRLAYVLSHSRSMLVADLCAQCNLTDTLMDGVTPEVTIGDALQPALLGPAFGVTPS